MLMNTLFTIKTILSFLVEMRKIILNEMDKLIDSSDKREDKILGSYYVLIGLVEISLEASEALPWLVQV